MVALVPFAVGPDLALLSRIGPAILWLGALLASLLALDRLIAVDAEDGSLDLLMMGEIPLELALLAKAIAHWLTTGLPLVVLSPLLGLLLNVEIAAMPVVALTLLAGTPALTLIGLIGAAADRGSAARNAVARGAGAAADDPGADLRHRRRAGRHRRARAVRSAVHDPVRAVAGQSRDCASSRPRPPSARDSTDMNARLT